MLWKMLFSSFPIQQSLQNNPLIQAIEFVFCFCLLLPIFQSMHYSFLWALEKSLNCSRIPQHTSGPIIVSLKPSFFKQGRKEDTRDLGISGMGISLKAFVADCATLEILARLYTSKSIFVWNSVSQPRQPCPNLRITWGALETSVIPVHTCTAQQLLPRGGGKALRKIFHEGRLDH